MYVAYDYCCESSKSLLTITFLNVSSFSLLLDSFLLFWTFLRTWRISLKGLLLSRRVVLTPVSRDNRLPNFIEQRNQHALSDDGHELFEHAGVYHHQPAPWAI